LADSPPLLCSIGFGSSRVQKVIAPEHINDGYCDCPADGGIDELATAACSGSIHGGWSGISIPKNSETSIEYFQCQHHVDFRIPLSHVDDGICDCCDGSDENLDSILCPDNCSQLLEAERLLKAELTSKFTYGSSKRKKYVEEFEVFYESTSKEIQQMKDLQIPELQSKLDTIKSQIYNVKLDAVQNRFAKVKEVMEEDLLSILPGSIEQLVYFIESSCQLSGELNNMNETGQRWKNIETCIPLRLAGIDLGMLWENEENGASIRTGGWYNDKLGMNIATILANNAKSPKKLLIAFDDIHEEETQHNVNVNDEDRDEKNQGHNDHADVSHDDDDDFDDDFDVDDDHNFDDDHSHYDEDHSNYADFASSKSTSEEPVELKSDEISAMDEPMSSDLLFRYNFYNRAKEIILKIDDLLDDKHKDTNGDDNEEEINNDLSGESELSNYDPMAIQMVRNTLSRRLQSIAKGLDYAASARVLLKALEESSFEYAKDLFNLAIGTIYHSNLTSADIVEIMLLYDVKPIAESCVSPYTTFCPVKERAMLNVNGATIAFPGEPLKTYMNDRCLARQNHADFCILGPDDIGSDEIPTSIPDGYYNYYVPKPRTSDDYYSILFEKLHNNRFSADYNDLEESSTAVEREIAEVHKSLLQLEKKLGGNKAESKYGPKGELFAIRDECYEILAAKYTYEVCLFGEAFQREGSDKKGGTSLGKWDGMDVDNQTGNRVMKWRKGTKCWNGPERSITVFITCGSETKLLSADEPSMCEYEMTMESFIACDDDFRERHSL